MTQIAPRRTPATSPLTLACVAAALLFGPSDGTAATIPSSPTPQTTGLLRGDTGQGLLAVFCRRGGADEFPDFAPLLTGRD